MIIIARRRDARFSRHRVLEVESQFLGGSGGGGVARLARKPGEELCAGSLQVQGKFVVAVAESAVAVDLDAEYGFGRGSDIFVVVGVSDG
jgi:hypothetical protein